MRKTLTHPPMTQFPIEDNELIIGGIPVTQLVTKVGKTPFYAYDQALIKQRIKQLRAAYPKDIHLHYAIKANPMPELVQLMATLVDGFDIASAGELNTVLQSKMPSSKISFAGPGKTDQELLAAIQADIIINMESFGEMQRIETIAKTLKKTPKVAIRVNPDFELASSGMKMSGGAKPFGVDAEQVPQMLQQLKNLSVEFYGFHIFCGSQNLKINAIIEAQKKTVELALQLSEHAPSPVKLLNIGGGLGIPYFPGDTPLDLAPIAENLKQLLPQIKKQLPEAEIVTELGRYLVAEAGVYVCKIVDKKVSRGETFLITDGGLNHHLAASGNFGQVIRKNYPIAIANKMNNAEKEIINIVGPLCTPLDILASKVELPKAEVGDLVAIYQSGAYGFTASPQLFLGHEGAVEVLV